MLDQGNLQVASQCGQINWQSTWDDNNNNNNLLLFRFLTIYGFCACSAPRFEKLSSYIGIIKVDMANVETSNSTSIYDRWAYQLSRNCLIQLAFTNNEGILTNI